MRSMTYQHGNAVLWAEINERGKVIIQSEGPLSAVARANMIDDALADLAARTRTPLRTIRACIIRKSKPWHRRLFAAMQGVLIRHK